MEKPIKLGLVQRAFAGSVLSLVKKLNNGFHYSFGGADGSGRGMPSEDAVQEGRCVMACTLFCARSLSLTLLIALHVKFFSSPLP